MSEVPSTGKPQPDTVFYRTADGVDDTGTVDFAPVCGDESRPWDPYWYIYEYARRRFVNSTQCCLDLACGSGAAALRLAYVGYEVEAIDLSEDDLKAAQRNALAHSLDPYCTFRRMTPENLTFANDRFDLVVGFDLLECVDVEATVQQTQRVLKPGGVALFKCRIESPAGRAEAPPRNALAAFGTSVVEPDAHEASRQMTGEDLRLIHNRFAHVETKRFTIFNRLGRLMAVIQRRDPAALQESDDQLVNLCPPLARLNDTAVIIAHK